MYKITMNEVPGDIRRRICEQLDRKGLESVHMGQESILIGDDRYYLVIAREISPTFYRGYSVFSFDYVTDELLRETSGLSYADALLEMGYRINE
ncbi:MAG: hypothetical protein ACI4JF_09065 [Oscillospiraceae bacterium]